MKNFVSLLVIDYTLFDSKNLQSICYLEFQGKILT